MIAFSYAILQEFLSTPSARRATETSTRSFLLRSYFYPRPPRGGRPIGDVLDLCVVGISIHALREEGDARYLNFTTKRG